MIDFKIEGKYQARVLWEQSLAIGNNSYLVIYGEHTNGWFIAIPNWGICIEAAEAADINYNTDRFQGVGLSENHAVALAQAISEADNLPKRFVRSDEICVSCGRYVPEGREICPICESQIYAVPRRPNVSGRPYGKKAKPFWGR